MTTCCTSDGATSARSRAALMAVAPSSVAASDESPPPSFPIGVRAAERMTVLGMGGLSSVAGDGAPEDPNAPCASGG